ncbi:MAG: GNAT family N-acetyltransferase [Candidatus Thermoplasmatota archaeon]|nr:GNAT family N-acetyltransferase [Candidatus Thermoplasmatota archaeon]
MNKLDIKMIKNKDELDKIISIRKIVFVQEQNVPLELEIDGLDPESEHFMAYLDGEPIGCARVRTKNNFAKLERIAIIKEHRRKGHGKELTNFLIDYYRKKNFDEIYLHSQIDVVGFYKKYGFKTRGETFLEADIKHIEMYFMQ